MSSHLSIDTDTDSQQVPVPDSVPDTDPTNVLGDLGVSIQDLWKVTPATLANYISGGEWAPANHLLYISKIIAHAIYEGLENGKGSRIIVAVPPRHGKSQLLSIWSPVWILEHWPWADVMLASYGADLSNDFSLASRDIILGNEEKLSIRLRKDKRGIDRWMTEKGGGMFAVGVGGPLIGRGANVLLIDDYIKNAQDAASPAKRDTAYKWVTATAMSRLEPGAPVIIISTRWDPDDVIGRIESGEEASEWTVISLPAICNSDDDPLGRSIGDAIWPERYPEAALHRIRRTVGPYFWKALYQQKPVAQKAGLFSGDDLQVVDIVPNDNRLIKIRAWDIAATEPKDHTDPDYTVGLKIAFDPMTKIYYILDVVREQLSPTDTEKLIKDTAVDDGFGVIIWLEQEPGSAGKNFVSMISRHVLEGYIVKSERVTGQKFVRAQPVMAAMGLGNIKMLRAPWNQALKAEIDAFPDSRSHDDQIDAFSLGYLGHQMWNRGGATWGRGKSTDANTTGLTSYKGGPIWGRSRG